MRAFHYAPLPMRVQFGAGSLSRVADEVAALGARRALVLCTPEQRPLADRVAALLGRKAAGVFDGALAHVPLETAREARALARSLEADCAVAVGGGSTIGLGKAIALESSLPILAIPTTYAGSEVTSIYGITEGGLKRTGRDPRVLPRAVLYDPELTLTLPVELSITSGINAIAHAAEGLYAADGNPITDLMAEEGVAALARALPLIRRDPQDLAARSQALYGSWLCGTVLANVSMALHHKLCHVLGGTLNLPHAQTHAIVLPHALAYNAAQAPCAIARLARALRAPDVPAALYDLARDNGAAVALRDVGMQAADLERISAIAMENQYPNPRPLEAGALKSLLSDAFQGRRPTGV